MLKMLNVDFSHTDDRGSLVQLVHEGFSQINVLNTKQGVTRGGHYHKMSKERFYIVSGSVDLTLKNSGMEKKYHFGGGDYFEIEPFTVHAMYFPEDCIMVAMYDIPVEKNDGTKDIYPAEEGK